MKINFDSAGKILSVGNGFCFSGEEYGGVLPDDFMITFGLGKYGVVIIDGKIEIQEIENWVVPIFSTMEL